MTLLPFRRRVLFPSRALAVHVGVVSAIVAMAACGSTTSTPAPSANDSGAPANDAASTGDGGSAADAAPPSCDGKATTCPFVGPGMPGTPGSSATITDPAACGVSPFGVDAGTTCEAFCKAQNPSGQSVHCVSSDQATGAFTCSCSTIP